MHGFRDQLKHVDYPTGPIPSEFHPKELPTDLPELARGFIWETCVDPTPCTRDQFEELKAAFAELPLAEEVRALLPDLHLAHLRFAMGDLEAERAEWLLSEEAMEYYLDKDGGTSEEFRKAAADWASARSERSRLAFDAAERELGL